MADSNQVLRDRLRDRPVVPIPVPTTTTDKQVVSVPCLFNGWSLRETTGAAVATVELVNGPGGSGQTAGEQQIASAGSNSQLLPGEGVLCEGGVAIHVIAGSVTGTLYARV